MAESFAMAPDFSLIDTQGNRITLSFLRGKCDVVLIFNRGFTCPSCRQHLTLLRKDIQLFQDRQAVILVVAPERPEQVREYWERERLPMIGLADPDHTVANLYHQEVNLFRQGRLPALALVDRDGRLRFTHFAESVADIPSNVELLQRIDVLAESPDAS